MAIIKFRENIPSSEAINQQEFDRIDINGDKVTKSITNMNSFMFRSHFTLSHLFGLYCWFIKELIQKLGILRMIWFRLLDIGVLCLMYSNSTYIAHLLHKKTGWPYHLEDHSFIPKVFVLSWQSLVARHLDHSSLR